MADLLFITHTMYPTIPENMLQKMVTYNETVSTLARLNIKAHNSCMVYHSYITTGCDT